MESAAEMVFELEDAVSDSIAVIQDASLSQLDLVTLVQRLELAARQPSVLGRQLYRDVQKLLTELWGGVEPFRLLPLLAAKLTGLGYSASIRQALGGGNECFRALRHEFIVVRGSGEFAGMEFIVEPALRQHFAIPHPSPDYSLALSHVPDVFVGGSCRLVPVVQLLCALMADSFERQGLALPPWRKEAAMLSKWLPCHGRYRDVAPILPASATTEVSPKPVPRALSSSPSGQQPCSRSSDSVLEPATPQPYSRATDVFDASAAALLPTLPSSGFCSPVSATQFACDLLVSPSRNLLPFMSSSGASCGCSTPALAVTGFKLLDSRDDVITTSFIALPCFSESPLALNPTRDTVQGRGNWACGDIAVAEEVGSVASTLSPPAEDVGSLLVLSPPPVLSIQAAGSPDEVRTTTAELAGNYRPTSTGMLPSRGNGAEDLSAKLLLLTAGNGSSTKVALNHRSMVGASEAKVRVKTLPGVHPSGPQIHVVRPSWPVGPLATRLPPLPPQQQCSLVMGTAATPCGLGAAQQLQEQSWLPSGVSTH